MHIRTLFKLEAYVIMSDVEIARCVNGYVDVNYFTSALYLESEKYTNKL